MASLINLGLLVAWVFGIVLAKGWMTLLAVLFPLYAYYLVAEHYIIKYNLIG